MADEFANDDVKLVGYSIISLKRGAERVLPGSGNSMIVTDNISEKDFVSWVIARYLQSEMYAKLKQEEKLTEEDKKYLFVDYTVKRRWERNPLEFEEEQIEELEGIRDALAEIK